MKRSFDVIATGHQSFEQRFPGKRRRLDEDVPQAALWRCNLTGLSQKHNLYFVAYGSTIHVFEPLFPAQTLQEPALILPCRPTGLGTHGCLDSREPNFINNLLVTNLGKDEVVAVVRDCGDVDVFLVRHVLASIRSRRESHPLGVCADEVRPVFQRNVGISAWGLAIHTQARIIAVSSNAHEVTVFKLGLTTEDDRPSDITEQVVNGECNIPCIAFCNTGDDPEARWLLTTDINGVCRTIDLKQGLPTLSFRFGRQLDSIYGAGFDRLNAGWTIMFLDSRSFTRHCTVQSAVGLAEGEELPDVRDTPHIWDLSKTARKLTESSGAFIRHESGGHISRRSLYVNQSAAQPVVRVTADTDVDVEIFEEISIVDDDSEYEDTTLPDLVDDEDLDEGTEDTSPASAYYGGERVCGNLPRFSAPSPLCNRLPCPILHASVKNIYMLQPSTLPQAPPWQPPFIGLAGPLKQSIQIEFHNLNLFDRLNMSAYISELGVVAVASQKGRVAVLGLTKLDRSTRYPPSMLEFGTRTIYSTRVEAILPLESQERLNQRPFTPLHGIAASPVQCGRHRRALHNRWRLLLMYADHSVLSYEIAKASDESIAVI